MRLSGMEMSKLISLPQELLVLVDALAQRPQLVALGAGLGDDGVLDEALLVELAQEVLEHLGARLAASALRPADRGHGPRGMGAGTPITVVAMS